MWAAILSCLLIFLPTTTGADPEMQFMAIAPSLLKANNTEKICVQLTNLQEPTLLKVTLDHAKFTVSVFDETVTAGDFFKCSKIYIPSVDKADTAYITIKAGNRMKRKSVVVNGVGNICLIQTDKPIYKARQEVKFRVICLNGTFYPVNEKFTLVEVLDPNNNRLMQQRDVEAKNSFATFSYPLIDEPSLGHYQIRVSTASEETIYGSFSAQEYVLPKFKVKLTTPKSVTAIDDIMVLGVVGSYTFDKPLVAKAVVSVCRNRNSWDKRDTCNLNPQGICEVIERELGSDGALNVTIDLQKFQLSRNGLPKSLNIKVTVKEKGTDLQVLETAYIWVSGKIANLNFDYETMDRYYKRGLNFTGSISLKNLNDEPIPSEEVQFFIKERYSTNCTTDKSGKCSFSVDTRDFLDSSVTIQARYRKNEQCFDSSRGSPSYPTADFSVTRFYSKSGSFVRLGRVAGQQSCGQTITVNGEYILNREAMKEGAKAIAFNYVVMSKAVITVNGQVDIALDHKAKGSFAISLSVNSEYAPSATVIVFTVLQTGEIVADSIRFEVERCFLNEVNLKFSAEKGLPGSPINLHLAAAPGSHCGLRAVDQSVILQNGGNDQSLGQEVFDGMPVSELYGLYQEGFDLSDAEVRCVNKPDILHEGLPYRPLDDDAMSVYDIFRKIGMQVLTGVDPRKPKVCPTPNYCPEPTETPVLYGTVKGRAGAPARAMKSAAMMMPVSMEMADGVVAGASFDGAVVESIRSNFPETWLFTDTSVNHNGTAVIALKIPDTITEWKANMFCISESQGFGATVKPASVIAFQEFFLEMVLPYSIIRKEVFILKVIVFNYLKQCVRLNATLAESSDYTAKNLNTENTGCVCQNERTTLSWTFEAKTLGYIDITVSAETIEDSSCNEGSSTFPKYKDTMVKKLLVEPEGIKREETQSALVCTKDSTTSETISLKLPGNVVEGSGRAFVTCLRDPMGISMQNLNDLVQMPSGCGEQNIAKFMSNLVAYKYLNATASLNTQKRAEILNNLNSGYARQLTFYSSRGFCSTWGRSSWNRRPDSSILLTAMCYRAFAEAADFIFIDEKVLRQTESWLASQQNLPSGAFENDGRSFNSIIRGNTSFTAYIAASFLKAKNNVSHPVVHEALGFLKRQVETSDDIHEQALMAYTFTLAGDVTTLNRMLGKLKSKEVKHGNTVHLQGAEVPMYPKNFYSLPRRAPSVNILANAYYLLCLLHKSPLSAKELTEAAGIGQWLGRQMNGNGGFASSTDTAVALEAMAMFQQLTYTKDGTNTVDLKFGNTPVQKFNVDNNNRLLLQRKDLPSVSEVYTANVTGTGCAYLQTTLRYNIELANIGTSFDLKVWTSQETCVKGAVIKFDININASYTGVRNSSNMVILDVKLPSGCAADIASLSKLRDKRLVSRYETSPPGHALFYVNEMKRDITSLSFTVEQNTYVENIQPSPVMMYDYYQTDEVGYTKYIFPCSQPSSTD